MATRKVILEGPIYWARVFPENRDLTGFEGALKESGGQTIVDVDLDQENIEKLKRSKSMKKGKPSPDNDGMTRVRFSRKWQGNFDDNSDGGAPKVNKPDGQPWDYDEDGPIGNGSIAKVILNVYDTSRDRIVGTRLEKIKVLDHKPYNPNEDEEEEETPKKETKKAKKSEPEEKESYIDDEIPFD